MNVLIAVASKHGATWGIAESIASELEAAGLSVDLRDVESVGSLKPYDAVILGSAIYVGNWLKEAKNFADDFRAQLREVPVWLFSSGPLGADEPIPPGDPKVVEEVAAMTQARGYRTFAGRLDPSALGFGERQLAKIVHAPAGDFRDWDAVRGWARDIGVELLSGVATTGAAAHETGPRAVQHRD